jgi:Transposase
MSVQRVERGVFPQDEQWGVNETVYSDALGKQMVWLSGWLTYEQSHQVFERIGERFIPASSVWRQTQYHGERLQRYVEQQRDQVSVERVALPAALHDHDQRKAVSMDGGMVNIRGDGWREVKVGAVFDVETRLERNPQTQELDELAHGVNLHYTAVLGTKEAFTPALWALAVAHDVPTAKDRAVVADGAAWIWNVAEDVCPDGRQIVDWFHAVQHLAQAATALYPDEHDSKQRTQWLKICQDHLYMGRIHALIAALHQRGRDDLAGYFERHQRRMQYLEFREEGLPIGSGTVESGVKQFKQRLTGTGMRWNADNADRMLVIRAAVLGDDFDALWNAA